MLRLIRRLMACIAVMFMALFALGNIAAAAPPVAADPSVSAEVTWASFDASTVLWLTAVFIPLIGGLVIRVGASRQTQSLVAIILNGANALLVTATTEGGTAILSKTLVMNFIMSTVISIALLYGIYKPLGADNKLVHTGGLVGSK